MMVPPLRSASLLVPAVAGPSSSRRDPLDSPLWENHAKRILGGGEVVFDDRVQVVLPPVTENQAQVPILVDARALGAVDEVVVITEMHPFPQTLRLEPVAAKPFVAFRMKIEQATPVRAAVRKDGLWHVGGRYLDAMGGGCSVPPVVPKTVDWSNVGQFRARAWREPEDGLRLRLRLLHPMDNGLIANIPVFIVETLTVADEAGAPLAKLTLSEAIADDPTLTLMPNAPKAAMALKVSARDNNGGVFTASVPIPAAPVVRLREGRL